MAGAAFLMASDALVPHAGLVGALGAGLGASATEGFTPADLAAEDTLPLPLVPLPAGGALPLLDGPSVADGFQADAVALRVD